MPSGITLRPPKAVCFYYTDFNDTEKNNTELSDTEIISYPINRGNENNFPPLPAPKGIDTIRWIENRRKYEKLIKKNIDYDIISERYSSEEITVRPNIRVRKFLEDYLSELVNELKRLEIINSNTDVLDNIKYIVELIYKMTV